MPTQQGSLGLLNDPVAQKLLHSTIPARLAYTWLDGTPRVVPIWFHWNGRQIVFASPPNAPKVRALKQNPAVAVTIDSNEQPYKVLLIRGAATVEVVNGVVPEYAAAAERYSGVEAGKAWIAQVGGLFKQMARISVQPEWVGIMDFEARFPSAIESAMAGAGS